MELIAEIIVHGEPISPVNQYKARAIRRGNSWMAMMYMDSKFTKHQDYIKDIAQRYAKDTKIDLYEGPVEVHAEFYFGTKRRKDLPNAGKLEFDALNGIIWKDDSQILKLTTEKRYDKNDPRVQIRIYKFTSEHWPTD